MHRLGHGLRLALSIAGTLVACGAARLKEPPYVGQATEALQPVGFPPPPARAEYVPSAPSDEAVWIDGEWTWQGARWAWKPGRWLVAPAEASFAPWTTTRDATGTLYFAEGRWRDARGGEMPEPAPLAVARTRAGAVINPKGESVESAPNVRAPDADGGAAGPADGATSPPSPDSSPRMEPP